MSGFYQQNQKAFSCLIFIICVAASAVVAQADEPTRFDVLYADSLEPVELEAKILDISLAERHVIVGEQTVFVVAEEEAQPPVTATVFYNRAGKKVGLKALKVRQRVLVRGFQDPSGSIIALEIQIIKKANHHRRQKKRG